MEFSFMLGPGGLESPSGTQRWCAAFLGILPLIICFSPIDTAHWTCAASFLYL